MRVCMNWVCVVSIVSLLPLATHAAETIGPQETSEADARLGEMVTIPAGRLLMGNNGHEKFGNAYEWTADDARSYPGNPKPFEHKGFHFVRGGCWDDGPGSSVRCSYRNWYLPSGSSGVGPGDSDYIGFRVAR